MKELQAMYSRYCIPNSNQSKPIFHIFMWYSISSWAKITYFYVDILWFVYSRRHTLDSCYFRYFQRWGKSWKFNILWLSASQVVSAAYLGYQRCRENHRALSFQYNEPWWHYHFTTTSTWIGIWFNGQSDKCNKSNEWWLACNIYCHCHNHNIHYNDVSTDSLGINSRFRTCQFLLSVY